MTEVEMTPICEEIKSNIEIIQEKIQSACAATNRQTSDIELLPVTKKHPVKKIECLIDFGFSRFGENYADELFTKAEALNHHKVDWVYIGQLQSNKIQRLVKVCSEIQTVSSLKHIQYVARYAEELSNGPFPIYLCLNAGAEPQKGGFHWSELDEAVSLVDSMHKNIHLKGIMCIPPADLSEKSSMDAVPELYQKIANKARTVGEGLLSMGMSDDLEAAIRVGSNCVRIGTALLGKR